MIKLWSTILQTDKDGHSAIHFVVEYKTAFEKTGVILLFLIQHGASTNILDKKGKLTVHIVFTCNLCFCRAYGVDC